VRALAELARKLRAEHVPRLSRRRTRALLRFDGATLRAWIGDKHMTGDLVRPDWEGLRAAEQAVREMGPVLQDARVRAFDWATPRARAYVSLREAGADVGRLVDWTHGEEACARWVTERGYTRSVAPYWRDLSGMADAFNAVVRARYSFRDTDLDSYENADYAVDAASREIRDLRERFQVWGSAPGVRLDGEHEVESGEWLVGERATVRVTSVHNHVVVVHAAPGATVHASAELGMVIVHAAPGATVLGPDSARGVVVISRDAPDTVHGRMAVAYAVATEYVVAPMLKGALCPAYPDLDVRKAAQIVLGKSPVELSDGQLTRAEAHAWCVDGAKLLPQQWLIRHLPMPEGAPFCPRSVTIARWMLAVHKRGAWGQLTRIRTIHGPAGATVRSALIAQIDEIQDVDLVEGDRTHVDVAFQRAAQRVIDRLEACNPESERVLAPRTT